MLSQSPSPVRPSEEKDRVVRRLRAEILPLKQQETTLPLMEHTCRELIERIRLAGQEKSALDQQYHNRIDAAQRTIAELKTQYERLKSHQRTLSLQMADLSADRNTLKAHRDKSDLELDRLRKQADSLFTNHELLIVETNKLLHIDANTADENKFINSQTLHLNSQHTEITLKLAEVRNHIANMQSDKLMLIEQIKKYEQENNNMEEVIDERETSVDAKSLEARKTDDGIRMQLDRLNELDAKTKRLKAESAHKTALLRTEQERGAEYQAHIRNAEKCVNEIQAQIGRQNNHCRDLAEKNLEAHTTNNKIVQDMGLCEGHLQNLVAQNESLVCELNKFAEEDEFIRKVLASKRTLRPLIEYTLKASRMTLPTN